jgi:hypothetical protein
MKKIILVLLLLVGNVLAETEKESGVIRRIGVCQYIQNSVYISPKFVIYLVNGVCFFSEDGYFSLLEKGDWVSCETNKYWRMEIVKFRFKEESFKRTKK